MSSCASWYFHECICGEVGPRYSTSIQQLYFSLWSMRREYVFILRNLNRNKCPQFSTGEIVFCFLLYISHILSYCFNHFPPCTKVLFSASSALQKNPLIPNFRVSKDIFWHQLPGSNRSPEVWLELYKHMSAAVAKEQVL